MPVTLSAAEVAALVGGTVVGDGGVGLSGVAPMDRAGPGDVTFLADRKYAAGLAACRAGAVLCTAAHAQLAGPPVRIVVADPRLAMLRLAQALFPPAPPPVGVHPSAVVDPSASLGEGVYLGPYVVVGARTRVGARAQLHAGVVLGDDVEVGEACVLREHVVCYARTRLGRGVVVHSGTRLGTDGFGYVQDAGGAHHKIPHVGRVVVGDEVEIGANCAIDRGSLGDTVVGRGTKIDNLVHVAHNVRIGERCLVMAQAGLAGSAVVEDGAYVLGQAGIGPHFTIGAGARVLPQGGVIGDIAPGAVVSGYPARPHHEVLRQQAALKRLAPHVLKLEAMAERDGSQER